MSKRITVEIEGFEDPFFIDIDVKGFDDPIVAMEKTEVFAKPLNMTVKIDMKTFKVRTEPR